MTNVSVPIPSSPIGTLEQSSGHIIMGREWYRFFGLLQQATGGSTDIPGDTAEQTIPDAEHVLGDTFAAMTNAIIDASGQAITARAIAEALQRRVDDLETQRPNQELGEIIKQLAKVSSGVYTPALTNVTNLDASTAYQCEWLRVGDTVTVAGRVDVDPTAAGQAQLKLTIPIASAFASSNNCGGSAFAIGIAGQGAGIYASAANFVMMEWIAVDVSNKGMFFSFVYQVI